jgi:RHS repeat-associated protein
VDGSDATFYTWDSRNRLSFISMTEGGQTSTAAFKYDALGRRIERVVTQGASTQRTQYVFDGIQAIGELADGRLGATILTGLNIDEVIARTVNLAGPNPVATKSYLTDALGSVLAMADQAQNPEVFYGYSAYGETQALGVDGYVPTNSNQYTARENDGLVGGTNGGALYYYRARYYDSVLQRFTSEDPLGIFGGLNLGMYVGGDPVSLTDPTGEIVPLITGGVGLVGGVIGSILAQSFACRDIDFTRVALAGLSGCVAGAALPFMGTGMVAYLGNATIGTAVSTGQTLADNYLRTGDVSPPGGSGYPIAQAMIGGAVGGLLGGVFVPPSFKSNVARLLQPSARQQILNNNAGAGNFVRVAAGNAVSNYPCGCP